MTGEDHDVAEEVEKARITIRAARRMVDTLAADIRSLETWLERDQER